MTSATDVRADPRAPDETDGAVEISGVTKTFGDATAVDDVRLEVQSGEFLSLLGPSGCGKTTLLRMIAGFEQPDAGDIRVGGESVLGLPPHRRPVNTVFQSYALFPHMTVAENVGYGLRQKRVPKSEIGERVHAALDMARMDDFADRNPRTLSGGQQQRVALARALVNRPKVLLLDEPMSALDRKLREELQIELKLLQRQIGITFIFVTHDQQEALSMSDRIVVMQAGRVEQVGGTAEVYGSPATAFVAGFIGKQNFLDGRLVGDGVVETADGRMPAGRGPASTGSDVVVAVRAEALRLAADGEPGIPARVAGVSFLGDSVQFVLITDSGAELLARIPPAQAPHLSTDDRVAVQWDESDARLFPREER